MTMIDRARSRCAAATACMVLSSVAILAEPDLRETIERYEIRGSTAKELKEQMKRLGPRKGDRVYDAYTKWKVAWTYAFVTREGKCAISSIDVYVDFTITLPQWNHSEVDADPGLARRIVPPVQVRRMLAEAQLEPPKAHGDGGKGLVLDLA